MRFRLRSVEAILQNVPATRGRRYRGDVARARISYLLPVVHDVFPSTRYGATDDAPGLQASSVWVKIF